jgi:hypothetical protein
MIGSFNSFLFPICIVDGLISILTKSKCQYDLHHMVLLITLNDPRGWFCRGEKLVVEISGEQRVVLFALKEISNNPPDSPCQATLPCPLGLGSLFAWSE